MDKKVRFRQNCVKKIFYKDFYCFVQEKSAGAPKKHPRGRPKILNKVNYRCGTCDATFVRHHSLIEHNNSVHLKIRYFCQYPGCSRSYAYLNKLRKHQQNKTHGTTPAFLTPPNSPAETVPVQFCVEKVTPDELFSEGLVSLEELGTANNAVEEPVVEEPIVEELVVPDELVIEEIVVEEAVVPIILYCSKLPKRSQLRKFLP